MSSSEVPQQSASPMSIVVITPAGIVGEHEVQPTAMVKDLTKILASSKNVRVEDVPWTVNQVEVLHG